METVERHLRSLESQQVPSGWLQPFCDADRLLLKGGSGSGAGYGCEYSVVSLAQPSQFVEF
jgi:hypothetical protein